MFAVHSGFILKENFMFLEEWIDYHITIGFNKFYLYDNSEVEVMAPYDKTYWSHNIILGKVNKHGFNYDKLFNITDKELKLFIKGLCYKYKCIKIIKWSPVNENNKIVYEENKAHQDCLERYLKKDNIDWCASIDMDEYIVIKHFDNIKNYIESLSPKIGNITLSQIRFDARFNNLDKCVTAITKSEVIPQREWDRKMLFRVKDTKYIFTHSWIGHWKAIFENYLPPIDEICFNHYNQYSIKNFKIVNNINQKIKDKISHNSEKYILTSYEIKKILVKDLTTNK